MNQASSVSRRHVGRPPRLTLDAIVDAARDIGVERLEMGALANRLGVGVATLYGYVRGRDHLIQLVGDRVSHRARLQDRGLGWRDVLREHAATSFAIYRSWPQLIVQMANGAVGTQLEAEYLDSLMAILAARGVAPARALALYYEINQLVIGAAVCAGYLDGAEGRTLPPVIGDYGPSLERLLADDGAGAADRASER